MAFGVNLIGYTRAEMGLGQAARSYARSFEAAKIPFSILPFAEGNPSRHDDLSWSSKESRELPYEITLNGILPDNFGPAKKRLPRAAWENGYRIALWTWELPKAPDLFLREAGAFHEIWVPTRFVQDAFSLALSVPVIRMPYAIEVETEDLLPRRSFGLPEGAFLFGTFFDVRSVVERKNPRGVIKAFQAAFSAADREVGLVIKVNNPDAGPQELRELHEQTHDWPNIRWIAETLPRREVLSLIAACDAIVSLHRSEGFGLVGAEAMALGKPCIQTSWSGNTDYMTPENSLSVRSRLVPLERDYAVYAKGQLWAEPDLAQAAERMRTLFDDRRLGARLGAEGQRTIREEFSPAAVGERIVSRFKAIGRL